MMAEKIRNNDMIIGIRLLLTLFLLKGSLALANDGSIPFGDSVIQQIEAAQKKTSANHKPCGSVDLYGNELKCESSGPEAELEFFKKNKIVKLEFPNFDSVPAELKGFVSPTIVNDLKRKYEKITIFAILSNDNRQLLGLATKEDASFGNDQGNTHGLQLGLKGTSSSGESFTIAFDSTLYTEIKPGSGKVGPQGEKTFQQNFLNQNTLKAVIDNLDSDNTQIWQVGVGFVQITPTNRMGVFEASRQQQLFHNTIVDQMNPHLVSKYKNLHNGDKDKYGAFVEVFKGLQQQLQLGSRCYLTARTMAGLRISTLPKDSFVQIGGSSTVGFKLNDDGSQIKASVAGNIQAHQNGRQKNTQANLEYVTSSGTTYGFSRSNFSGSVQPANKYDKPNASTGKYDPIIRLYYSTGF